MTKKSQKSLITLYDTTYLHEVPYVGGFNLEGDPLATMVTFHVHHIRYLATSRPLIRQATFIAKHYTLSERGIIFIDQINKTESLLNF